MKKIYSFTLLLTILSISVNAQHYGFTKSTDTYVTFDDGTVISGEEWDDEGFVLDMPFAFQVFGDAVNNVVLADIVTRFRDQDDFTVGDFLGFSADLISRGSFASPISAKVEGETPNQILKVQYKNAGFALDGSLSDYANFQLWIYEGSNILEVRFGDCSVTNSNSWDGETGPRIEIVREDFSAGISLKGDPNNPTVVLDKDLLNEFEILTGVPNSGTVYTFTPRKYALGVEQLASNNSKLSVYPNPVNDMLTIQLHGATKGDVEVIDVMGKVVYTGTITHNGVIETENYKQGIYFIRVSTVNGVITEKVIKN